jgi:hypothetical protein
MTLAVRGYSSEQFWNTMPKSEQEAMLDACITHGGKLLKEGPTIGDSYSPGWGWVRRNGNLTSPLPAFSALDCCFLTRRPQLLMTPFRSPVVHYRL